MSSTNKCLKYPILILVITLLSLPAFAKPNFVIIFIDDMGYSDIEAFGSKLNRTPELNKMAAEGMKFTSFYAAPVCSASRAQLLTGSYAPRVSIPGVLFPRGSHGLNPDEHTVADYLKELGYSTMCVGKWHLGDQREFLPVNNGFDSYFGIPYSNDMARMSLEDGRQVHPLVRDDEVIELLEYEDQRRITREYTEESIKFIEANKDKPFFLYLPHTAMHIPIYPHKDFVGKSKNGRYGDWVEEVDWSTKQIIDTLKKHDLDKNTLVIFTSDNGPWASKGKDSGLADPLRGAKGGSLEGGVRVPTIAWWPGKIPANSICDGISGTTDILPTFVSLAGGKVREDITIDGHDISNLLFGKAKEIPNRNWHYFKGNSLKAVRSGPWKLALEKQSLGMELKNPPDLQKPMRLYNLEKEIGEVTNVAEQHPHIVARLKTIADEITSAMKGNRRSAGYVHNPVMLYPTREPKPRPSPKPIEWSKVKKGDSFTSRAPYIANRTITINATVQGETDGIILAQGGSAVGYCLYRKNNNLVFAVRHGAKIQRLSIPAQESMKIIATLTKDGVASLAIDGADSITEKAEKITKHPQEPLDIAHDSKNVVDAQAPGPFTGKISSVKITVK